MTRERIRNLPDDDWRRDDARFNEPQVGAHLATADRVQEVAERLDVSPGAVAIAWTLRNPAVDAAIVGVRRPDQVDELLAGGTVELSDDDAAFLEGPA
jgi:aryl-alcohol dehydrogenase-like predicted oxidoreductase